MSLGSVVGGLVLGLGLGVATVAASRSRRLTGVARRLSDGSRFGVATAVSFGVGATGFVGALVPGAGPLPDALGVVPATLPWAWSTGWLLGYVVVELLAATAHYRAHPDYESLLFSKPSGTVDDWQNVVRRFRIWRYVMATAHWWLLPASLLLAIVVPLTGALVAPPVVVMAIGWYAILVAPAGLQFQWWEDDDALRKEMDPVLDPPK